MMRFRDDESGQMLVLTAICMTLFFGFMALAIDVGLLFRARRNAQIAADAGAIAGAMQMEYGDNSGCATVLCAVQKAAAANGVPNADLTVNLPPTDGYHQGAGYVEVIASIPKSTFFIGTIYKGNSAFTVSARSVAGIPPNPACLYVLDPSDPDTLYIKGKGQVSAPGCGIQVNSTSPNAACNQGAAKIVAPFLHIAGGQDTKGPCKTTPNTQVVAGVVPSGDPLNNFTGPTSDAQCSSYNNTATSGSGTKKSPYQTAISGNIGGPGAGNTMCFNYAVSIADGTVLGAGTYVFFNGVTLNGTVQVNSGTLDVEQGNFTQNNAQLSITAPSDAGDSYYGIALMQPSTNTTASSCDTSQPCLQVQFGSGNENLTGLIYAPTSELYMQDEGGGVQVTGVVAYQLYVNSQLSLTENYNTAYPSGSPLDKVSMVE